MTGDPLITNATVTVFRDGVQVGAAGLAVMIEDPEPVRFDERGGARKRDILFNVATDINPGDDVLLVTFNNRAPRNPGPYEVEDAVQVGGLGLELLCVNLIGFTL